MKSKPNSRCIGLKQVLGCKRGEKSPITKQRITIMRAVKVTYTDGTVISTSMAKTLTDADILNYFRVGKWFNIGSVTDNMQQVTAVEILA